MRIFLSNSIKYLNLFINILRENVITKKSGAGYSDVKQAKPLRERDFRGILFAGIAILFMSVTWSLSDVSLYYYRVLHTVEGKHRH